MLDELGPGLPEAVVTLIDALRNYIKAEKQVGEDLLMEGSITRAQFDELPKYLEPFVTMLRALEEHGVDPTLQGLIKWRFRA